MWSDEIDKKIKEAAEGYNHPAYDDKAWDNMEVLLDKHLPVEKKKRRFILFWLLPLALVGTGLFFILQKQPEKNIAEEKKIITPGPTNNNSVADKKNLVPESKKTIGKQSPLKEQATLVSPDRNQPDENKVDKQIEKEQPITTAISKKINPADREERIVKKQSLPGKKLISKRPDDEIPVSKNIADKKNDNISKTGKPAINTNTNSSPDTNIDVAINDRSVSSKDVAEDKTAKENKATDSVEPTETSAKRKMQKTKSSLGSKVSFYIAGGPDISSVGFDNPGKWEFQYGAGLSYALSKRISIRAGFFTASKIYTADPEDYQSSYQIPNLQKIEANCKVYEIPLNIIYNFHTTKNHNWFVAGGLSSYLMKKETYDYHYKNAWGQMQVYSHSYKNENKHLFSVINLSGGYQYHFTDRIFLLAEPYVRIPVRGIGNGKVKLNSGGVLFTAGFKPFVKK